MAKATISLKNGSTVSAESVYEGDLLDFFVDWDESKEAEISQRSNSGRNTKFIKAVSERINGETADGEAVDPLVLNRPGGFAVIAPSEIASVEVSD